MSVFWQYFAELTLLDADPYLKYPPSVIAASAITLALHTFNLQAWVGVAGAVMQACISRCKFVRNACRHSCVSVLALLNWFRHFLFCLREIDTVILVSVFDFSFRLLP